MVLFSPSSKDTNAAATVGSSPVITGTPPSETFP
jgi:hypothetical protein